MRKSICKQSLFVVVVALSIVIISLFFILRAYVYESRVIRIEKRIEPILERVNEIKDKQIVLEGISSLLDEISDLEPNLREEIIPIRKKLKDLYHSGRINVEKLKDLILETRYIVLIALPKMYSFSMIFGFLLMVVLLWVIVQAYLYERKFVKSIYTIGRLAEEIPLRRDFYIPTDKVEFLELENLVDSLNALSRVNSMKLSLLDVAEKAELPEEITERMYEIVRKYTSADSFTYIGVHNDRYIVHSSYRSYKVWDRDVGYSVELSLPVKDAVRKGEEMVVVNYLQESLGKFSELSYVRVLAGEGVQSVVIFPIYARKCIGVFLFGYLSEKEVPQDDIRKLKAVAKVMNVLFGKGTLLETLLVSTVTGFARLVEKKDQETGQHLQRMALYSRYIARELVVNPKYSKVDHMFVEQIFAYAPLHDIGKVGVPERILLKPGKLTPEEFEIMKRHTVIGYEILRNIDTQIEEAYGKPFFWMGERIARHHHERWDGKGYPDGLKGEEIPVCARIVAVADVFDALISERAYKAAFGYDTSVNLIIQGSGTQFDPGIVDAFVRAQKDIRKTYEELKD